MTPAQTKLIKMGSKLRQRLTNVSEPYSRQGVVTLVKDQFFIVSWKDPNYSSTTFNRDDAETTKHLTFVRPKRKPRMRSPKS